MQDMKSVPVCSSTGVHNSHSHGQKRPLSFMDHKDSLQCSKYPINGPHLLDKRVPVLNVQHIPEAT
jgi:hypothetical protein